MTTRAERRRQQRALDELRTRAARETDLAERAHWDDYQDAYEKALRATSTKWAPWYVIPADHKWVARAIVADIVTTAIRDLDLKYPEVTAEQQKLLEKARVKLSEE